MTYKSFNLIINLLLICYYFISIIVQNNNNNLHLQYSHEYDSNTYLCNVTDENHSQVFLFCMTVF